MRQQRRPAIPAQLLGIRNGAGGTLDTLKIMSQLVKRYKTYVPLRQLALGIIREVPGRKNFVAQIQRIQDYVRNNIQYVKDINGVETVQTPDRTVQNRSGDCDDQAVLVATLLETIGHPTRFVAVKTKPFGPFEHVFAETRLGRRWVSVETTEDWPIGYTPQFITKRMSVHN